MKFYARPKGRHIHSSLICPMLNGKQFEHYGYKEISLDEAVDRKLELCLCIYKDTNLTVYSDLEQTNQYVSIDRFKRMWLIGGD